MIRLRATIVNFFIVAASLVVGRHCFATPSFTSGIQVGTIQNGSVIEASGIAASRMNANVLWTHNDSGDSARVFAITPAGTSLGTYSISGAGATDWEDIAVGPGPTAGAQYLYIGDIGDNGAGRSSISVYRVPEPVVSDTQSPITTSISGAAKFTFAYPDGARDAESLFVDPLTKDIYIISKPESSKHLYRAAYPQSTSGTTTLELMTSFSDSDALTAADISPNGNEIIVRSYATSSGRMYVRPAGGSITDAFNSAYTSIPVHSEGQGEAIGFDPNGWGYYTTSEGSNQPIYYFNRLPPPAGTMHWDNDGTSAGTDLVTGIGLGGTGTWNTSAFKWYDGSAEVAWVDGNDAIFWGAAGTVTLGAARSVNSLTFKTIGYVLSGSTLTLGGPSVTVNPGVTATISSAVAGTAGLVKNGSGILELASANSYTGGTTIAAGTLLVLNTTGSGTGTGAVTVNAGAVLGGTGTIQGNVSNSGSLLPGYAVGTLHIGGTYTQAAGGKLLIELASVASHDELAVSGIATLAGMLTVAPFGAFSPHEGDVFQIITAAGFGGTTFSSSSLPTLPGNLAWNINYGASAVTLAVILPGDFNGNGIVDAADYVLWRKGGVTITPGDYSTWRAHFGQTAPPGGLGSIIAVPEPAAWVLFGVCATIHLSRRQAFRPLVLCHS